MALKKCLNCAPGWSKHTCIAATSLILAERYEPPAGSSAVFRTTLNHRNATYTTENDRVFDPSVTLLKMSYAYCPVLEDGGVRWRGFRFGSATEQVSNAG